MLQDRTFKRAPITKILIAEITRTTHSLPKGEEQYEAQTYLTPTGRTITKVMIGGVAIDKENIGQDQPMWRLRVTDPSGAIHIFAGQYQPESAQVISQLEIPSHVAIVGKLNLFQPEEGTVIVSIRPDSVTKIDRENYCGIILDASLLLHRELKTLSGEKIREITRIYGDMGRKDVYLSVARQAVESLLDGSKPPQPPPAQPIPAKTQTAQDIVLSILKENGQVKYEDLPEVLKKRGTNPDAIDWMNAVKRLMEEGYCCEPRLGIIRAVT